MSTITQKLGIFSAIQRTIATSISTAADVVTAAQESVGMATTYVHHRAVAQQVIDKDTVVLSTTLALEEINEELKDNPERQELFRETAKLFN